MRHGRYTIYALIVSAVFHVVLLSVLAVTKSNGDPAVTAAAQNTQVQISRVKKLISDSTVVAVPKISRPKHTYALPLSQLPIAEKVFEKPVHSFSSEPTSENVVMINEPVRFFTGKAQSKRVCYLVDCSGSMKGLFGQVKQELSRSIENLRADQYFGIIFFGNSGVIQFDSRLRRASPRARAGALAFIKSIEPRGKTNALIGLEAALKLRDSQGSGPEAVFFLTDGFELSGRDASRFRQNAAELYRKYLPDGIINTIGFWANDSDKILLKSIARDSGGEFVYIYP